MLDLSTLSHSVTSSENAMSQGELSALLEQHHVWLKSAGEGGKRLVLNYRNLSNISFYNSNLEKCIFSKCDLSNCNFSRAKLRHAVLKRCNLKRANFSHVKFEYASLSYSTFFCTDFHNANLHLADLTGTNLKGAHLFGTRLPADTWLILGEEYSMQITHGVSLIAGCQVHKIEDWRRFRRHDIESMDGERAVKFYPRLLDILDFYTGTGERPDWL
ncbi:pentapeptide repeat-containing protein [Pantoea rodasii]|nr:pentapeptide repeat-containing protein [Pantoea rodasii]